MPTTTNYIWDEQNYLAETDVNNVVQTVYTNEPQQYGNLVSSRIPISGMPTTFYHHFDALGSSRQLSTSAGAVSDTLTYDAWGNVVNRTGSTGVVFLWIGLVEYYFDIETGSIYIRARLYAPVVSRWTTVDPSDFVDTANRFVYVANSVVHSLDPSGTITITPIAADLNPDCGDDAYQYWDFELEYILRPAQGKKPAKSGAPVFWIPRPKSRCVLRPLRLLW